MAAFTTLSATVLNLACKCYPSRRTQRSSREEFVTCWSSTNSDINGVRSCLLCLRFESFLVVCETLRSNWPAHPPKLHRSTTRLNFFGVASSRTTSREKFENNSRRRSPPELNNFYFELNLLRFQFHQIPHFDTFIIILMK
jgi:hypothetical protein